MNQFQKEKLLKLLFNPYVIAIPFALITSLLLPLDFNENSFETYAYEPADKHGKNTVQYYFDLDKDGTEEIISHFQNDVSQCAIKIIKNQKIPDGQWNFNGIMPQGARKPVFIDFNEDGILDVFVFYQRQDSLFIGAVDMQVDSTKLVEDFFLDKIKVVNNTTHYQALFRVYDLDMDGRDELLMLVNAGYSEQPRRLYAWDFKSGKFFKSQNVGFRHASPEFADIDRDGFPEIIPSTISYENIEKGLGIPFNDYERWFVIYDNELNFKYGPVKIGSGGGSVRSYVVHNNGVPEVFLLDSNQEKVVDDQCYKIDLSTDKPIPADCIFTPPNLSTMKIMADSTVYYMSYQAESGRILIFDPGNRSDPCAEEFINPGMSFKKVLHVPGCNDPLLFFEDFSLERKVLRFFSLKTFSEVIHFSFSADREYKNISVYKNPVGKELLAIQLDEHILSLELKTDPYYFAKMSLVHIFIYAFYIFLIWLILKWQDKILKRKYQREQMIAELKLKTIRNQLDPHFTFNAVNAIASSILKEDKEKAYNYFSTFSKLLRSTTLYSDRMTRNLNDELEITMQYLDIELFRFRDKFEYNIHVDKNVNVNQQVPRMIVQTFAESAVTNGLMHRKQGGKLKVEIRQKDKMLELIFEDNGVGIEESKKLNKHKAFKSIKIMDEFIRIFNDLNHTGVKYKMEDISTHGQYPGTRVTVSFPADFRYKIDSAISS